MRKKDMRSRTETLSLRLTAEEKERLKSLAAKNRRSLTDYILLSALRYSSADSFRPMVKSLDSLRAQLLRLRESPDADTISDTLELESQVYDQLLAAICRA